MSYDLSSGVTFGSNLKSPGHPISASVFAPFLAVMPEQLSGQILIFCSTTAVDITIIVLALYLSLTTQMSVRGPWRTFRIGDEFRSGFLTFPISGAS